LYFGEINTYTLDEIQRVVFWLNYTATKNIKPSNPKDLKAFSIRTIECIMVGDGKGRIKLFMLV